MEQQPLESDRSSIMIKKLIRNLIYKTSLDFVHPIGSFYDTDDADFDPNKVWGGSWELYVNRVRVGAGDLYQLGDEFGEAEHTLTVDEMPNHTHRGNIYNQGSGMTYNHVTWGTCGTDNIAGTAVGGSQPHNNLQPSYAVYMWHRIA